MSEDSEQSGSRHSSFENRSQIFNGFWTDHICGAADAYRVTCVGGATDTGPRSWCFAGLRDEAPCTGGQVFTMSKVQCLFCSENCTTEGKKREEVQISINSTQNL